MANVNLTVKLQQGDGAVGSWIVIDDLDVTITNGVGTVAVDGTDPDHSVLFWFTGPAGATLAYEISQGNDTLVKGKSTISFGQKHGRGGGDFKIRI